MRVQDYITKKLEPVMINHKLSLPRDHTYLPLTVNLNTEEIDDTSGQPHKCSESL